MAFELAMKATCLLDSDVPCLSYRLTSLPPQSACASPSRKDVRLEITINQGLELPMHLLYTFADR